MPKVKPSKRREPKTISEADIGIRPVGQREHKNRSFVFYGRSASGKTTIAASFPKPLLLLDCKDEGEDSISDVKGVFVKEIRSSDDMEKAYWYVKQNPKKFKSVCIDTMTGYQQILIEEISGAEPGKAGNWGSMRKQDWGDVASEMKRTVIDWRDLPVEMVFIAQDRVFGGGEEDEAEGIAPEVGPALMPSVAKFLNASVSAILNTFIRVRYVKKKDQKGKVIDEKRKLEYCLRVAPHDVYITKIRKPKGTPPPDVIVDANYDDIIEVIEGE